MAARRPKISQEELSEAMGRMRQSEIPEDAMCVSHIVILGIDIHIFQKDTDKNIRNGMYFASVVNQGFGDCLTVQVHISSRSSYMDASVDLLTFFVDWMIKDREEHGISIH